MRHHYKSLFQMIRLKRLNEVIATEMDIFMIQVLKNLTDAYELQMLLLEKCINNKEKYCPLKNLKRK
jgi:hypothetical protein